MRSKPVAIVKHNETSIAPPSTARQTWRASEPADFLDDFVKLVNFVGAYFVVPEDRNPFKDQWLRGQVVKFVVESPQFLSLLRQNRRHTCSGILGCIEISPGLTEALATEQRGAWLLTTLALTEFVENGYNVAIPSWQNPNQALLKGVIESLAYIVSQSPEPSSDSDRGIILRLVKDQLVYGTESFGLKLTAEFQDQPQIALDALALLREIPDFACELRDSSSNGYLLINTLIDISRAPTEISL